MRVPEWLRPSASNCRLAKLERVLRVLRAVCACNTAEPSLPYHVRTTAAVAQQPFSGWPL